MSDIYRLKAWNQILSLNEFAESKTVLTSKPSKVLFELMRFADKKSMPMDILFKACNALLEHAYFCDIRGLDSNHFKGDWETILTKFKSFPLINWHMFSSFTKPQPAFWDFLVRCGFMAGFEYKKMNDVVLKNLETFSASLKKHKLGYLYFITIVHKSNISELKNVLNLASRLGVHSVQFITYVSGNTELHPFDESDFPSLKEALDFCVSVSISSKIRLTINDQKLIGLVDPALLEQAKTVPYPKPNLNFPLAKEYDKEFWRTPAWGEIDFKVLDQSKVSIYKKCFKPFHYTHVSPTGDIGPCNHLLDPMTFSMGNIATQRFEEIWNGQKYQDFRKQLLTQPTKDLRCKWCFENRLED